MTRNPLYLRIKASALGHPITVIELPDAVAMGAALLAGIGAGGRDLAEGQRQMRREEYMVEPEPAEHAFYERFVREVYAPAYPMIRPLHEAGRRVLGAPEGGSPDPAADVDGSAQHVLRDDQIVLERAQRRHAGLGQRIMVGAHRVRRPDLAVDHALHQGNQGERVLGQIDLAPEQHEPRAAALRGREQLEGIARRAGAIESRR